MYVSHGDLYTVGSPDDPLNKEQYEAWLKAEREKGPITHVFHWVTQEGNDPIIETEDTTFPDGFVWKESRERQADSRETIEFHNYSANKGMD